MCASQVQRYMDLLKALYTVDESSNSLYYIFSGSSNVKNPPTSARDARDVNLMPGSGRSPGVGNGNPLQYSCLENSIDSFREGY